MEHLDLSILRNLDFGSSKILSIGWVEEHCNQPPIVALNGAIGEAPAGFIEKLDKVIIRDPGFGWRGFRRCGLCGAGGFRQEPSVLLSNGSPVCDFEVWLPGRDSVIYVFPDMIMHYCRAHKYLPPQEFIDAVMAFDLDSEWTMEKFFEGRVQHRLQS